MPTLRSHTLITVEEVDHFLKVTNPTAHANWHRESTAWLEAFTADFRNANKTLGVLLNNNPAGFILEEGHAVHGAENLTVFSYIHLYDEGKSAEMLWGLLIDLDNGSTHAAKLINRH